MQNKIYIYNVLSISLWFRIKHENSVPDYINDFIYLELKYIYCFNK